MLSRFSKVFSLVFVLQALFFYPATVQAAESKDALRLVKDPAEVKEKDFPKNEIIKILEDKYEVLTQDAKQLVEFLATLVRKDRSLLVDSDTALIARRLKHLLKIKEDHHIELPEQGSNRFSLEHAVYAILSRRVSLSKLMMDEAKCKFLAALVKKNRFASDLEFFAVSLSAPCFSIIAAIEQLTHLECKSADLEDQMLASLKRHERLTSLNLDKNEKLTEGAAQFLIAIPNLKYLNLRKSSLGHAGIATLVRDGHLRELNLTHCKVNNADAVILASSVTLEKLFLSHNDITTIGAREFLKNNMLQVVELHGCANIDPETEKALTAHLAQNQKKSLGTEISETLIGKRDDETIYVLEIDGGGTRGVIPAIVLKYLKDRFAEELGVEINFARAFHLIVATSTGALIATGLAVPGGDKGNPKYAPEKLIELYMQEAKSVFPNSDRGIIHRLFGPKYNPTSFEKMLQEYFGEQKLSDLLTRLLIATVNLHDLKHYIFDSKKAINAEDDFLLWQVDRAASAAPTYFSAGVCIRENLNLIGIDGGLVTNNHSLLGLFEAMAEYPNAKKYYIISLGCGATDKEGKFDAKAESGGLAWLPQIHSVVRGAAASYVDQLMDLYRKIDPRIEYKRIQPELTKTTLDDATEANMAYLKQQGEETLVSFKPLLEEIVCELTKKYKGTAVQKKEVKK